MKPPDRSWIKLLGFFAFTTLASSLVMAAMLAGVTVALAGGESAQIPDYQQVDPTVPGESFSGTITDARCGPRHADSEPDASECARMCVRNGSRYVFVEGARQYELAGNSSQFGQLAGKRVSLIGVLNGVSIKPIFARLQAADGQQQSAAHETTISAP